MSNVVVNELEIKVQSTASGALSSLTKVMNRLDNLQKKMDSFSSKKVVSELGKINSSLGTNATNNIDKLADALKKLPSNIKGMSSAFTSSQASIMTTTAKLHAFTQVAGIVTRAVKNIAQSIGKWVTESMDYVETLNLFNVTMGQFAEEATEYAEQVESIMGINIADWMNAQAVFMALGTGFGVAADKAYLMSKNLTQLGYDLSSFYNIKTADAMEKLQAGISGELEPLRRLGFDLSMAKLQEIALANGINQRVESMTQAEKAQLRYIAIMQQSVNAQGDMARTLNAPANQLRILQANAQSAARALGNIFIPALNAILPAAIVALQAIRMIADAIAALFGFSIPEVDYGNAFGGVSSGASDAEDAIDGATGAAKKFKQATLGFDELNVIAPQDSSGGGGSGGGGGGGYDFELPEYDFLAEMVKSKIQEMMDKLLEFYDLVQSKVPTSAFDYMRDSVKRLISAFDDLNVAFKRAFGGVSGKDLLAEFFAMIETTFLNGASDIASWVTGAFEVAAGMLNLGSVFNFGKIIGDILAGTFDPKEFAKENIPVVAEGIGQLIEGAIKMAITTFSGTVSVGGLRLADLVLNAIIDSLFGEETEVEIDMDGWWIALKNAIFNVDISKFFSGVSDLIVDWWNDDIDWTDKLNADNLFWEIKRAINEVLDVFFHEDDLGLDNPFTLKFEVPDQGETFFQTLETTLGPIRDLFREVSTGSKEVQTALQGLWDALVGFGEEIGIALEPVRLLLREIFLDIWPSIEPVVQPVIDFFAETFNPTMGEMGEKLNVTRIAFEALTLTIELFSDGFRLAFTIVRTIFLAVVNFFAEKIRLAQLNFQKFNTFISTTFEDGWETGWRNIKTGFLTIIEEMVNEGISKINGLISKVEEAVNSISSAISSFSHGFIDFGTIDLGRIEEVNWTGIQKKASGGFVNTGELFIANEAGPELVGSIGSRTAVANNDQIVSGIAAGVYSAMSAALADNATSDGNINITVKLDSDVIYRKTEEKKRQRGYNMGMGAFAQ